MPFHHRFVVVGSVLAVFCIEAGVQYLLFCCMEAGVSYPMSRCCWRLERVTDDPFDVLLHGGWRVLPDVLLLLLLEARRPSKIIHLPDVLLLLSLLEARRLLQMVHLPDVLLLLEAVRTSWIFYLLLADIGVRYGCSTCLFCCLAGDRGKSTCFLAVAGGQLCDWTPSLATYLMSGRN